MKIINKKEFLKLPAGVLYSRYEPSVFRELEVKGETISTEDWRYDFLIGNVKCSSSDDFSQKCDEAEAGKDLELDFDICGSNRDGMYEEGELFAVYSTIDLISLIKTLGLCRGYNTP